MIARLPRLRGEVLPDSRRPLIRPRTRSVVRLLGGKDIEKELAAMAAGDGTDATALRQARRLVQKAREIGEAD